MCIQKNEKHHVAGIIALVLSVVAGPAFADKPPWAGGDKGGKAQAEDRGRGGQTYSFGGDERRIIADYYGAQVQAGKCPPGLAKKNNGCQPPGKAKQWHKGQPLGRDVAYFDLPKDLRGRLPPAPANHRYVQIAGDVLLIATGTGLVVDAIEDILR